jgi:capsular exopolysaccharide synthesis family protein
MSKNFELLTHVEGDRGLFSAPEKEVEQSVSTSVSPSVASLLGDVAREEVAKLVQRVFLTSRGACTPRAVAFCGVGHGDGATWICAQVALAVATQGATSVCAVDANLRSPGLHSYLGTANRCGLAEAVRHAGPIRKFLEPGPRANLCVLPAGVNADPSLLLISERLRERVAELRAEFDFLIFDAPPAGHANDAAVLGALLDGVVLVIGAHSTRRETARKVKGTLEKGNVRLLGTVLNGRTFPIPDMLYRRL